MNGLTKGAMLGIANVVVIAIAIASGERDAGVFLLVAAYGSVPGTLGGAVIGMIAHLIGTAPVPVRISVLVAPAVGIVFLLAHAFGLQELAPISCIPTVVAALVLERWTRVVEPPPVPVARISDQSSPKPMVSVRPTDL